MVILDVELKGIVNQVRVRGNCGNHDHRLNRSDDARSNSDYPYNHSKEIVCRRCGL